MSTGAIRMGKETIKMKTVAMIFAAGMAWGTVIFGIHLVREDVLSLSGRVSNIEKFLIPETHGKFVPEP